jgi:hypothetical protein
MPRFRISIHESTDVPATLDRLRANLSAGGITGNTLDGLFYQVTAIVNHFVEKGEQTAAIGGEFKASKSLKIERCKIIIDATFGCGPPSVFSRIRSILSWR